MQKIVLHHPFRVKWRAMPKLLEGKTALVLGVWNKWSIAYAIAQAFAREGATLLLTYQNERAKPTVAELGGELGAVLDRIPGLPAETMTQLRDLAARLSGPPVDVDSEWQGAVDILEPLAGQSDRRGRPFWKR